MGMFTNKGTDKGTDKSLTNAQFAPVSWIKRFSTSTIKSQAVMLLGFLIIISLIITALAPRFLQIDNLSVILRQTSFVALVSLGQMTAMLAGVIDLSVGSTAGLAGICAALLMNKTVVDPYLALCIGLLVGVLIGFINGTLVTKLCLNPFIVTLSMSFILSGVTLVVTRGWAIPDLPDKIHWLGKSSLGPFPVPMLFTVFVAILLAFMLNRTYIGRHLFAIGGNKDAAILVGIPVNRRIILVYVISGTLSAMAGLLMVARLASGQPTVGSGWLLPSFAAPILGGAALSGGAGSVLGTLVGAAIMAVIQNGIVMTGMSVYWENVVVGVVLIAAIIIDKMRRRSS